MKIENVEIWQYSDDSIFLMQMSTVEPELKIIHFRYLSLFNLASFSTITLVYLNVTAF